MPNTPFTHKPVLIVLLDIMARGTVFAKRFTQANPEFQCCCLCGTERFGSTNEKTSILEQGSIRKVYARSSAFSVPSDTLDMVTLNDCDNLDQVSSPNFVSELVRTLKPGGLFISAHRLGAHPHFGIDTLVPVAFFTPSNIHMASITPCTHFTRIPGKWWTWMVMFQSLEFGKVKYPASPTIQERLVRLEIERLKIGMHTGPIEELCPRLDIEPSLRVWRKREE